MKECSICMCGANSALSICMCDVQTLSFETNYNYLFCITKYAIRPTDRPLARQQNVCTQKASYADTDLVVDSNRTEQCIDIMNAKRQADLRHTTNIIHPLTLSL